MITPDEINHIDTQIGRLLTLCKKMCAAHRELEKRVEELEKAFYDLRDTVYGVKD